MRRFLASLVWCALGLLTAAGAAESEVRVRTAAIAGQEYVNLADWAQARAFQFVRTPQGEDVLLSNRWARLAFKVNSRQVVLKGVNAIMSLPVVAQRDSVYVSQFDLRSLIQPVLYPSRPDKQKQVRTVVLDPGHGGKDPGNQARGEQEKKHTLLLAQEVRRRLQAAGLKVVLTRTSDDTIEREDRPALARKHKADLFLSLHYNSIPSGKGNVDGVEVYALTPANAVSTNEQSEGSHHGQASLRAKYPGNRWDEQNALLGYLLQRSLSNGVGLTDRGLKRARWTVLCYAEMPAALVEAGFMSDPQEGRRILTPAYRRQVAISIVDGVLAYKRIIERPPATPTPKPKRADPSAASR